MLDVSVPEVEDPARFFPEPVFLKRPEVRKWDGAWQMWDDKHGRFMGIHPMFLVVLDRLAEGRRYRDVLDGLPESPELPRSAHDQVVRKFLWTLAEAGNVRLDLEPPPAVFAGRYRRIREVGRGGMGVVHLCEDTTTGAHVAVKHAWGVKRPIQSAQNSIATERDFLARLDHPTIPRLLDAFEVRGLLHIVREYVDGKPLAALYGKRGARDEAERRDVVRQVASSLQHVHERGFVFFDVAPGNYVRDPSGRVSTIDVGVMRALDGASVATNGARGTPGYVARELYNGAVHSRGRATPRSDVFSLGRLWYFLMTGKRARRLWTEAEFQPALAEARAPEAERDLVRDMCRDDPDLRPDVRDVLQRIDALAPAPQQG